MLFTPSHAHVAVHVLFSAPAGSRVHARVSASLVVLTSSLVCFLPVAGSRASPHTRIFFCVQPHVAFAPVFHHRLRASPNFDRLRARVALPKASSFALAFDRPYAPPFDHFALASRLPSSVCAALLRSFACVRRARSLSITILAHAAAATPPTPTPPPPRRQRQRGRRQRHSVHGGRSFNGCFRRSRAALAHGSAALVIARRRSS